MPRPANGFRDGKALVRVHHEFEFRPECAAHGGQSRHILCDMGLPDLDLDAAETLFPRRHRMIDKFLRGEVQPAACLPQNYSVVCAPGGFCFPSGVAFGLWKTLNDNKPSWVAHGNG